MVKNTLLHLDEGFKDVGFAGWMPFRYADQWLMFCGIMQRVLAANGLIHSEHAEVYRKLLEETPAPIEPQTKTPQRIARTHMTRGCPTMADLKRRLKESRGPP